jgi:hypothetical protein
MAYLRSCKYHFPSIRFPPPTTGISRPLTIFALGVSSRYLQSRYIGDISKPDNRRATFVLLKSTSYMEDLGTLQAMGSMSSSKQAVANLINRCLLPSACPLPTSNTVLAPACRCSPVLFCTTAAADPHPSRPEQAIRSERKEEKIQDGTTFSS